MANTKEYPCRYCPKKGCGSYHDICEEYQKIKKEREEELEKKWAVSYADYDYRKVKKER